LQGFPPYNWGMAHPARRKAADHLPPLDPAPAVDRAYHLHRARRRARVEHRRNARRAHVRFWVFLLVLIAATIALAVVVWHELQRLFGL
jgi:hypothetical protein